MRQYMLNKGIECRDCRDRARTTKCERCIEHGNQPMIRGRGVCALRLVAEDEARKEGEPVDAWLLRERWRKSQWMLSHFSAKSSREEIELALEIHGEGAVRAVLAMTRCVDEVWFDVLKQCEALRARFDDVARALRDSGLNAEAFEHELRAILAKSPRMSPERAAEWNRRRRK